MSDKEDLVSLGSFCKDFLEAADFPAPYYRDSLGMKVGKTLPQTTSNEIENLRKKRVAARIKGNIDDLCTTNIQLAEAFLAAAEQTKDTVYAQAVALIPQSACTPSLADAFDRVQAPRLASIVRAKSAGPSL